MFQDEKIIIPEHPEKYISDELIDRDCNNPLYSHGCGCGCEYDAFMSQRFHLIEKINIKCVSEFDTEAEAYTLVDKLNNMK